MLGIAVKKAGSDGGNLDVITANVCNILYKPMLMAKPLFKRTVQAYLEQLYAHALVGFNFNKIALLFDSGAPEVYDAPISMFKSICDYLKWENIGTICIPNMENK